MTDKDADEKSLGLLSSFITKDKHYTKARKSGSPYKFFHFFRSAVNTASRMRSETMVASRGFLGIIGTAIKKIRSRRSFIRRIKNIVQSFFYESYLTSLNTENGIKNHSIRQSPAVSSVIGGVVGQEVIKALTYTDMPISQMFMFESFGHTSCLNPKAVERISDARILVVGAGAIGSEILKNLVQLRFGHYAKERCSNERRGSTVKKTGVIYIADMDVVERSNLNRQLLFK